MLGQWQVMDRVHGHDAIERIRVEWQVGNVGDDEQTFIAETVTRFLQRGDGNVCAERYL